MKDRTFIQCSCGFSGEGEVRDKDAEIGKAVAICPECSTVHIVKICRACGVRIPENRDFCEACGGMGDEPVEFNKLIRTETGVV